MVIRMKKLKDFAVNYEYITALLFFIIISASTAIFTALAANDVMWNFSASYRLINGFSLYQDMNTIITPLSYLLPVIPMMLFGNNLLTYIVFNNLFMLPLMYMVIYKLFRTVGVSRKHTLIYFLILHFFMPYSINSYNNEALMFIYLGIIALLSKKEKIIKFNWLIQGLLIFLTFMTKQNVTIFYIIAYIVSVLLIREKKKEAVFEIIKALSVSFVLLLGFLLVMHLIGLLPSFLDYAVFGIGEFTTENFVLQIDGITKIGLFTGLIIGVLWIASYKKLKFKKYERNCLKVLSIFGIFTVFLAFPLSNGYHIYWALYTGVIAIFTLLDMIILREITDNKTMEFWKSVFILVTTIIIAGIGIFNNVLVLRNVRGKDYPFKKGDVYYGIYVTRDVREDIKEVLEYIKSEEAKGYNVEIISYKADLYMNILNRCNGEFDLPFAGNLGSDGYQGLIEQIKELKNTKVLVLALKDAVYQEVDKVTDFIRNNYQHIGDVSDFAVYYIP